jgi:pimeloyl-ACP methyl ester carboxylesterase
MKNISLKKRVLAIASALAITTTALVAVPTAANAAPVCSTKSTVYADEYVTYQECVGVTSDGAQYVVQIPILFDGTLFLFSHGYRYSIDIPASIPVVGGYKVGKTPEPAPSGGSAAGVSRNAVALLAAGYATAGSGFTRKGWNADAAVATNAELIKLIRKEFTDVKRVVAWGESLGAFITQGLAEKHSKLINAAGLLCPATGTVEAELKMAGDALWGLKAFFDPTIKGGDYKSVLEVYSDIGKVLTVAGSLSALFAANPTAPAWPTTSAAPAAIKAIPSRSALVLVAAMSGVPTQSQSFDGSTGPGAPSSADAIRFASAVSPALGALENIAGAAILGVLATYDIEQQAGGPIFDNSATNYADQLGDGLFEYGSALSGLDATQGMLAYLAAFPRAKANATAVTKMRGLLSHKGKFNVPTIGVAAVADNITPAGNLQWLIDKAAKKKSKNLLPLWQIPADSYTKFSATGVVTQSGTNGTGHCNATTSQILSIAKMLDSSARSGKLPAAGTVKKATAAVGGLTYDPTYGAALLKFYQK